MAYNITYFKIYYPGNITIDFAVILYTKLYCVAVLLRNIPLFSLTSENL